MKARPAIARLAAMDREELRLRALCEARKLAGRVRFAAAPPAWRRERLVAILEDAAGPLVREARESSARGDHLAAHRALAHHFTRRQRRWPLAAARRNSLTNVIRERFPAAADDAQARGERILAGRYDLLGYYDLSLGNPPDWHADAVHGRRAARGFWAGVPYLDPQGGDHKVIWEVNRHQYVLQLGTAFWLTGDTRYRGAFIEHLEDWLRSNPPLDGINWASMLELAFRALSWTWAIEFFCQDADRDREPWLVDLLVALDRQLTHVGHNLSTYFSPNTHLTGEALALYAVSRALPELRGSAKRADRGRAILLAESSIQVAGDGGHAELSSHYHRYSTDFYLLALLVARLTGDTAAAAFERTVRAQGIFLRTIADARGRLAHLGDDDGGQLFHFGATAENAAPTLSAIAAALDDASLAVAQPTPEVYWILGEAPGTIAPPRPVPWPSRLLVDSGYFVSRDDERGDHLIFDAGRHGFLNGGHAHADALSLVVTVAGAPLLIDPGTATYTMDPERRDLFRSPQMHNTVTVDGAGFAQPDGPFHWRRTADARMLAARSTAEAEFAVGRHDGYGFPHVRAVVRLPGSGWLVADYLQPPRRTRIETWWHLDPSWSAAADPRGFLLSHRSGVQLVIATTAADRLVEQSPCSPAYGRIETSAALRTVVTTTDGAVVSGTYIPAGADRLAAVAIRLAASAVGRDGWRECRFIVGGADGDREVGLAFPGPEAQPSPGEWPQPCIEGRRAICVE